MITAAVAVALFRQASAMSQDLFPSSVALIFHQDLALMMVESKPSPDSHPKDSQWGSGLDSVVANPCVKMMSHESP